MKCNRLIPLMTAVLLSACATQPRSGGEPHAHTHAHTGSHRHDSWPAPPPRYAGRRGNRWADLRAIARGAAIYRRHCQSCHGEDGRGDGPMAAALPHPPADLTHHFHRAPGLGDDYLFWRVSEGGKVEPFLSQQSVMPAFKSQLTVEERWAVLAYIHTYFHLGLADWKLDQRGNR